LLACLVGCLLACLVGYVCIRNDPMHCGHSLVMQLLGLVESLAYLVLVKSEKL